MEQFFLYSHYWNLPGDFYEIYTFSLPILAMARLKDILQQQRKMNFVGRLL